VESRRADVLAKKQKLHDTNIWALKLVFLSLFLPPLLALIYFLWTSPQTPFLLRIFWARARELAGRAIPQAELEKDLAALLRKQQQNARK